MHDSYYLSLRFNHIHHIQVRRICPVPSYARLYSVATTLQQSFSFRISVGRCQPHPGVSLAAGDLLKNYPRVNTMKTDVKHGIEMGNLAIR